MSEEELQNISRALTHMLFRNVPLVWFCGSEEEIQELLKHIGFSSIYGRGTWEKAIKSKYNL